MKKRLVGMMLATSMVFLLLTGCGGSGSTGAATTGEAQQTESTEEKDAAEEQVQEAQADTAAETTDISAEKMDAAEGQVTEAQADAAVEPTDTPAKEKKVRVKTMMVYDLVDGEKVVFSQNEYDYDEKGNRVLEISSNGSGTYSVEIEYEYDEYGNLVHYKNTNKSSDDKVTENYYENELDEVGRVLKQVSLDADKNPTGEYKEYSYTDDQYTCDFYNSDGSISSYEEGFISDGIMYATVSFYYSEDHPKTDDEESYATKMVYKYEGTTVIGYESYSGDTGLAFDCNGEIEEVDENNNPTAVHRFTKGIDQDREDIIEYTYVEIE